MNKLKRFVKKEKFLLLILFIMLINPFSYGYRIAILLVFFVGFKLPLFLSKFDKNVIYLFLFAFSYEFFAAIRVDAIGETVFSILPNIFIPSLLYLVGKYLSTTYQSDKIRLFILFFIAFAFSLIPLISILLQIVENGFISGTRYMYLIWDKSSEIAATRIGSYFAINMASIALINTKKITAIEKRITYCVIILFLLSLICVLRLGDRTELVIALFSLILSYLSNLSKQPLMKNIIIFCVFGFVVFYISQLILKNSTIISYYADRMNDADVGIGTAGGRLQRWTSAFQSITTDPFGWKLSRFGYAHNLWLDVARVSGVVPLMFLLFFTVSAMKSLFRLVKKLKNDLFLMTYILSIFFSLILICCVEPVMDGLYLLFLFFCLFIGYISGILNGGKVIK